MATEIDTVKLINIEYQGALPSIDLDFENLKRFSCEFAFGKSYLLDAEMGHGAWALSWIVAGLMEPNAGTLLRNGVPYSTEKRRKESWCVRRDEIKRFGLLGNQTVRWQIRHGLRMSSRPDFRTETDYIERFLLTLERYNRGFRSLSNEAWRASCAVGLANGKRIFCFPHMSYLRPDFDEEWHQNFFKKIIDLLRDTGALVLIPTRVASTTQYLCDEVISLR